MLDDCQTINTGSMMTYEFKLRWQIKALVIAQTLKVYHLRLFILL